jgi:RimJ/RimL family protein N-acetyltransferase
MSRRAATERLRIRSPRGDDLADLVALIGNWEIARRVSSVPHPYSEADRRKWIACAQQDHATGRPRRFAIALKETDCLIGRGGSTAAAATAAKNPRSAIGWASPIGATVRPRSRCRVRRTLGIETIRAYTDPSNVASQRVLLRCGLKNVGEIELLKPTRQGAPRPPSCALQAGACIMSSRVLQVSTPQSRPPRRETAGRLSEGDRLILGNGRNEGSGGGAQGGGLPVRFGGVDG